MAEQFAVLVADGHPLRHALGERLRRTPGVSAVHIASTLESAIRLAQEHAPHIVICDPLTLGAPATIGDVVRRLRREVGHVIVLTSSLLEHERQAITAEGATGIIFKGAPRGTLTDLLTSLAPT